MNYLKAIFIFLVLSVSLSFSTDNTANSSSNLSALNDEFNDAKTLSNWKIFSETEKWPNRIDKIDINSTLAGHLYLVPTFGGWWNGFQGAFIYKEVSGDFLITSKLMVKGKKTPLPTVAWNRGGILVRKAGDLTIDPKDRKENFVHIMTGVDGKKNFVVYTGNSKDNDYEWANTSDPNQKESIYVELGILKAGDVFISIYKVGNQDWKILKKTFRSDLKDIKLQIGITGCAEPYDKTGTWLNSTYSAYDFNKQVLPSELPADVQMFVDYFRIYNINLPAEDKNSIIENSLTDKKLLDKINLIMTKK
jgi:hypothetical protein